MSWSFHIKGGDLNTGGPGGYVLITGIQKLIQDLRHWILHPQGADPMHLGHGSSLDTGVRKDGSVVEGFIGTSIIRDRLLEVESELRRILYSYQDQQLQRLLRDQELLDGKNTFAPNEILYSVDGVEVNQFDDRVVAQLKIRTQNNTNVSFVQPVE